MALNLSQMIENAIPFKGGLEWGLGQYSEITHPYPSLPLEGEGVEPLPPLSAGNVDNVNPWRLVLCA